MTRSCSRSFVTAVCFAFFVFVLGADARAQAGGRRLSIRDALALAERGSEDVGIARTERRARSGELRAARSGIFPRVSVSASYERTLESEFEEVFAAAAGADDAQTAAFENLPFGRANTYRFGVSVQQNLFAGGGTIASIRRASASLRSAELGITTGRADAVYRVARAYYDAVLADTLVAIAEAALAQAERTLKQVRLEFEAGRQPEFEVLRAQVAVGVQRPILVRERMARDLAYLELRRLLDLPRNEPLVLTSALEDADWQTVATTARELAGVPPSRGERVAIEQARVAVDVGEEGVRAARAGYFPNVSLYTSYERVAYPGDLVPSWDEFRTNWVAGVSLTWTPFDGLATPANVATARALSDQARLRLRQARELSVLEEERVAHQLVAARAAFDATAGVEQEAQRAYEIAELRYQQGVSTQLEVFDARLRAARAAAERARAARDLIVASVERALLPALPVVGATQAPRSSEAAPATFEPQPVSEGTEAAPSSTSLGTTATPGRPVLR